MVTTYPSTGFLLGNLTQEHCSHLNMGTITKGNVKHSLHFLPKEDHILFKLVLIWFIYRFSDAAPRPRPCGESEGCRGNGPLPLTPIPSNTEAVVVRHYWNSLNSKLVNVLVKMHISNIHQNQNGPRLEKWFPQAKWWLFINVSDQWSLKMHQLKRLRIQWTVRSSDQLLWHFTLVLEWSPC